MLISAQEEEEKPLEEVKVEKNKVVESNKIREGKGESEGISVTSEDGKEESPATSKSIRPHKPKSTADTSISIVSTVIDQSQIYYYLVVHSMLILRCMLLLTGI